MAGWTLVVDFGTTSTSGAIVDGDGVTLLEVDGSTRMPSTVRRDEDGTLVVGAGAEGSGWAPDTLDRNPKRSLGRSEHLVLGGEAVEVVDAVAAVLRAFADEGRRRRGGEAPEAVVLTHPVSWGERRRQALGDAAGRAGLPAPRMVSEPVAAALHYRDRDLAEGDLVAVYDLGGGTFDTAVLRATGDGFTLVGEPGGDPDLGGEHLDDLLFQWVGAQVAERAPDVWEKLRAPVEPAWQRRAADLRREVRVAKEALSRTSAHTLHVDAAECDVRITRTEFEELIRPSVQATVAELLATIGRAGVTARDLCRVYLVGGSSRIPLVTRMVADGLGTAPETYDDPKCVVALGAARLARPVVPAPVPGAGTTQPVPLPPAPVRSGWRRPRVLVPLSAVVAVLLTGGTYLGLARTSAPEPTLAVAAPVAAPVTTTTTTPAPAPVMQPAPAPAVAADEPEPTRAAPRTSAEPRPRTPEPEPTTPEKPAVSLSIYGPTRVVSGNSANYSIRTNAQDRLVSCRWTDPNGEQFSNCGSFTINYHEPGTWTIRLTVTLDDGTSKSTSLTTRSS